MLTQMHAHTNNVVGMAGKYNGVEVTPHNTININSIKRKYFLLASGRVFGCNEYQWKTNNFAAVAAATDAFNRFGNEGIKTQNRSVSRS